MGIIKKQGISNSILIMLGAAIGAINVMILFPKIISEEYFGLTRVLVELSYVASQFGLLGGHMALVKYWSLYKKTFAFVRFVFFYILVTSLITLILLIYFQIDIKAFYSEKSSLFNLNYDFIYVLFLVSIVFEFLTSIATSLLKSFYSILLKDVLIRIYVSILILSYGFDLISEPQFILFFVLGYVFIAFALAFILLVNHRSVLFTKSNKVALHNKIETVKFSVTNFITSFSSGIVNRLDVLMIAALIGNESGFSNGLQAVAVYTIALYTATILGIPSRGLFLISHPLIAQYWNEGDYKNILTVYKKSAINLSAISILMFVLLWTNIDDLLSFLGGGYQTAKSVIFILAMAKLFNMALGVNNLIIGVSKYYRIGSYIMVLLVFITFTLNYILIPKYGIIGAAVGSFFSLVFYNSVSFLFLYFKFNFQPFTFKTVLVYFIGVLAYLISTLIYFDFVLLNIFIKSLFIVSFYLPLIYFFKISEDINEVIDKVLKSKLNRD